MEVTRQLRLDALNKHGTAWSPSSSRAAGRATACAWARAGAACPSTGMSAASTSRPKPTPALSTRCSTTTAAWLPPPSGQPRKPARCWPRPPCAPRSSAGRAELPPAPAAAPLTFFDHFTRWIVRWAARNGHDESNFPVSWKQQNQPVNGKEPSMMQRFGPRRYAT